MATIYKRGKTYTYAIDIGTDAQGIRRKKTKGGFDSKKKAQQAAAQIVIELADGIFVNEKKIKLSDFIDMWLKSYAQEVKASTQANATVASKAIKEYFGGILIKDINREKYQSFLNNLSTKYKRSTIITYNGICHMIFKSACKMGVIKTNPMEYTNIPRKVSTLADEEDASPKYLEKNELATFLQTLKDSKHASIYALFFTIAYTGMRIGEATALEWDDIDFKEKTIHITKGIYFYNSQNYILQTPKTRSSRRTIAVTDNLLKVLGEYRKEQLKIKMHHLDKWEKSNFIFTKEDGFPLLSSNIRKKMVFYLKKAGIDKKLSPHSLRHTHTSLLAEAGVSLEAIQERLGHKNDTVTRAIYLHITKSIKKEAAQKFDELMNGL